MKKYINLVLILVSLFTFSSCQDFIEKNPVDQLGEGDFYTNDEELNAATMACYAGLRSMANLEWRFSEIRSDNSRLWQTGSSSTDNKNIISLDNFRIEVTHTENQEYWEASYKAIDYCNVVLENLDVASTEEFRNQIEGEASFIRAYIYFNLVRLYGPAFLVTERLSVDQGNALPRSTVEEVYNFIENRLLDIINNQKLPTAYNDSEKGRATIWAARTLLAKVYLTLHRYTDAKTQLTEVMKSSHSLEEKYANVFSIENEMNDEIIFAIRYLSGGYGQGSPFANYFSPIDADIVGKNYAFNCPTNDLIEAYNSENDEVRKNVSLVEEVRDDGNYRSFVNKFLSIPTNELDAENDWILLRYADVILMMAEVENELNGFSAALPYVNETRTRVGLEPLTAEDVSTVREMRLAIEKERRLEFAFENHRYYDLLRTGRLTDVMKEHYNTEILIYAVSETDGEETRNYYTTDNSSYTTFLREEYREIQEWQYLLPIPLSVISVAANATQNPGY